MRIYKRTYEPEGCGNFLHTLFFLFQDLVKLEGGYVNVKCEYRGGISAGESFICPQGKNKLYLKPSPFSCLSPGVQSAGNAPMYIQPKVQHGIKYSHSSLKETFCMVTAALQL